MNNLIAIEIEEDANQKNQPMAANGERQLVMKEYARPIIGVALSCIQLVKQPKTMS